VKNDLEFVQRCVKGDRRAWDKFVDKYSRLIYNYIYSVLEAKSTIQFKPELAKELFQEIFVLLSKDNFAKLKTFKAKNECSLASWLRQVAINFTLDYARKQKPLISLEAENEEGFSLRDSLADNAAHAEDILCAKEKLAQLKYCIEKLDIEDKYLMHLYIYKGLNIEEARNILRISRSTIDMRKYRLLEKLRECFRSKGFEV